MTEQFIEPLVSQKLVVVITDEAGRRHERVELTGQGALIVGRGWHCDLIVQDPLVDAEHARVVLNAAGELHIEDMNSLNGTHLLGDTLENAALQLGNTRLEFHRTDVPVPPAQRLSRWDGFLTGLGNPVWPLMALLPLFCLQVYFNNARALEPGYFVSSIFYGLLGCGVWALFWGVLSKLLRNSMRLAAHFSVICWGLVSGAVVSALADFLGWQTQSVAVGEFIGVAGSALVLFVLGAVTLGLATAMHSRRRLLVAVLPSIALAFFAYGLPLLQDEEPQWAAPMVGESYPPGWQWGKGRPLESFLEDSELLFDRSTKRANERAAELYAPDFR